MRASIRQIEKKPHGGPSCTCRGVREGTMLRLRSIGHAVSFIAAAGTLPATTAARRWIILSAVMLMIASAAPGLAPSGLAAQPSPPVPVPPLAPTWSISLSTEAGQPGTQVRVSGSNWWPGQAVELHWGSSDGPLLGATSPGRGSIGGGPSRGTFALTFTVPDVPPGVYEVWAVGGEPVFTGQVFYGGGGGTIERGRGFSVEPATVRTEFVVVPAQPDRAPPVPVEQM